MNNSTPFTPPPSPSWDAAIIATSERLWFRHRLQGLGSLEKIEQIITEALAPFVQQLKEAVEDRQHFRNRLIEEQAISYREINIKIDVEDKLAIAEAKLLEKQTEKVALETVIESRNIELAECQAKLRAVVEAGTAMEEGICQYKERLQLLELARRFYRTKTAARDGTEKGKL